MLAFKCKHMGRTCTALGWNYPDVAMQRKFPHFAPPASADVGTAVGQISLVVVDWRDSEDIAVLCTVEWDKRNHESATNSTKRVTRRDDLRAAQPRVYKERIERC